MKREAVGLVAVVVMGGVLSGCCGLPRKPVSDVATHIADTAAAGKAAYGKCIADKTNCDQVVTSFDLINKDAEVLKSLSGGAQ
jgi:hypothetical protein